MGQARVIVVGNEKGGAGKSTVSIHLAVALMHEGARVGVVDLDLRQGSARRFFCSRAAWAEARGVTLFQPEWLEAPATADDLASILARDAEVIIVDTPGADTALARSAHGAAALVVTPMNDSFMDLGVLGEIDPVSLAVTRPSLYAETVWEARKARAAAGRGALDWVVLRNRLASTDPRNRRRVDERVATLARRVGFRPIAGLRDRVIYRELIPFGLTVQDLSRTVRPVEVSLAHVAARQELRALIADLGLIAHAVAAE